MIFKNRKINNENHESGVTLILSLLVLAAISVIAFSVAALSTNEVRTSGDESRSEPAIVGAQAGAEDALFESIRGFAGYISSDCTNPTSSTLGNGVKLKSCTNYYQPNPYYVNNLGPNQNVDFFLYDPTNQSNPPGYTGISFYMYPGAGNGQIHFCSFSATVCLNSPDISNDTISPGGTKNLSLIDN